jgi:hypothetical protein
MFYFLWLGEHGRLGPFDNTQILRRDPDALQKPDSPLWGPVNAPHHWGESAFGYYLSRDEWVLRRHAQMLSDAGVDVVIFDVTNHLTYPRAYDALCRVWSRMRREGNRTPQIAFLTPFFGDRASVVKTLYTDFYRPGIARELWFQWQGKPLILADPPPSTPTRWRRRRARPPLWRRAERWDRGSAPNAPSLSSAVRSTLEPQR